MSDHASTQEIIYNIEKKDKRFRLFQTMFMVGTFVALIFIIGAQQRTLSNVEIQVSQQQETANDASKERTAQLEAITRRLDCMVVFFSTPDREGLTIDNVENCSLNRDPDLNKFFQNEPDNTSENPPNLTDSAPTATQENVEAQQEEETQPAPEKQVYILGIPVCIPFTGVCVTE